MRKNICWSLLTILLVMFMSVCIVSCGDDDDDTPNVLVGKWEGDHSEDEWIDLTFRSDGTGLKYIRYEGGSGWDRKFKYTITGQGTRQDEHYGEVVHGTIHVIYDKDGSEEDWSFKIELKKYLTINGYECIKQ